MDKLIQYLVYKKNPLRSLGLVGFKSAHLEADPVRNKLILDRTASIFKPSDNLSNAQRTLAQFICQESLYSNVFQKISAAIMFALALPFVLILILKNSLKKYDIQHCDVFIFRLGDLDYVKEDFKGKKTLSVDENENIGQFLGMREISFFIKHAILSPSYLIRPKLIINVLRWLSAYAWVVKHYNPKIVATFFEGTASSSLMTEYLNTLNIQHYNYMHGEQFRYDCYSAYANFNKFTSWGQHFKELQIEKHSPENIFTVRAPQVFKKMYSEYRLLPKENNKRATVLIHSGVEKGSEEYQNLLSLLKKTQNLEELLLRPHPVDRASWPQVMSDLKNDLALGGVNLKINEELPEKNIKMHQSVVRSKIFIGSASTALLEAYLAGCKVIYLQGRTKNSDIIDRHKNSENVMVYDDKIITEKILNFIERPYVLNAEEDLKLKRIFAV